MDGVAIARYNAKAHGKRCLQTQLGPSRYEGAVETAPVILLLANPGFDETSCVGDHQFSVDGWPLSGLHPTAPVGMRDWWRPRLRKLCEIHGEQKVAQNVAAIQINPWASTKFDSNLLLPSRAAQIRLAESAAERGAVLVIIRAAAIWRGSEIIDRHSNTYRTNSYLSSFITPGNLPAQAWLEINKRIAQSATAF